MFIVDTYLLLSHTPSIWHEWIIWVMKSLLKILEYSDTWQLECTHYGNTARDGDVTRKSMYVRLNVLHLFLSSVSWHMRRPSSGTIKTYLWVEAPPQTPKTIIITQPNREGGCEEQNLDFSNFTLYLKK